MSVSLAEVALAARARQAPLPAESAGYLVLAVADQVALAARAVRQDAIELNEDGSVRLSAAEPASEVQAESQLRALLGDLLKAASSLTPALARVTSRAPQASLAAFIAELEAALIPVNRAAARRALARLSRETARAVEQGLRPAPAEPLPPEAAAAELTIVPAVEVVRQAELSEEVAVALSQAEPEVEVEIEVEPTPEPMVETRREPLARRASSVPPEPFGRTPRLGTMMAPSVRLEAPETVTDLMPSVEPVEVEAAEVEAAEVEELEVEELEVEELDEYEVAAADPPAALDSEPAELAPESEPEPESLPVVEPRVPRPREPRRSDIGDLLKSFASDAGTSEPDVRRELKKIAGLDLTPPPTPASDP